MIDEYRAALLRLRDHLQHYSKRPMTSSKMKHVTAQLSKLHQKRHVREGMDSLIHTAREVAINTDKLYDGVQGYKPMVNSPAGNLVTIITEIDRLNYLVSLGYHGLYLKYDAPEIGKKYWVVSQTGDDPWVQYKKCLGLMIDDWLVQDAEVQKLVTDMYIEVRELASSVPDGLYFSERLAKNYPTIGVGEVMAPIFTKRLRKLQGTLDEISDRLGLGDGSKTFHDITEGTRITLEYEKERMKLIYVALHYHRIVSMI